MKKALLAVDLDGTLIRTDMLYETFWSAFAKKWTTPFVALAALSKGKPALKATLAERARVDVTTLPYNTQVIDYVKAWREDGGKTALVTASDQGLADQVATHLDIFDEAHGTVDGKNLKGPQKAAFLVEHSGKDGFAYMGDTTADVPVWQAAEHAVTVNAPDTLRRDVEKLDGSTEHLQENSAAIKPYIKAMRPHQWLKNVLIFLPMFAAHKLEAITAFQSLMAFVAFSVVASSVYLMNDLLDLAADRAHPRKCKRPLASGALPIAHGTAMAPLLLLLGFGIAFAIGWKFALVMTTYYVITTAYSLTLKRLMVIDICTLSTLYTIRIMAGAAATEIPVSAWLLAFSTFFFFSLATVKRQAELVDGAANDKEKIAGRGYLASDAPLIAGMALASGYVSVLVMALYLNSPAVQELYSIPTALWGICLVLLYWLSRIILLAHRGHMHDDPVVFAARDRVSQICLLVIIAIGLSGALL